jgi:hypothetical protein
MSAHCEILRARELPTLNESYISPEERPVGAIVDLVIFVFGLIMLTAGLLVFALAKYVLIPQSSAYYRYLSVRFFPAIVMVHLGGFLAFVCSTLAVLLPFDTFPCWMTIMALFVPALLTVPPAVRYFTFYRQYQISKAAAESAALVQQRNVKRGSLTSIIELDQSTEATVSYRTLMIALVLPTRLKIEPSTIGGNSVEDVDNRSEATAGEFLSIVKVLKVLSSTRALITMFLVCLIPYVIMFAASLGSSEFARSGCNTCTIGSLPVARNLLYIGSAIPIVVCGLSFLLVRKIPDALYVVREVRAAFLYFGMPAVVFLIGSSYLFRVQDFSLRFFYLLCILGFCITQSLAPASAVLVAYYRDKRQTRVTQVITNFMAEDSPEYSLANDTAEFERILNDPAMHDAFMEHLMTEHSVESLRFHDEIGRWVAQFHDVNPRTAHVRAKKIVSLFVGEDAMFPVNLPSDTIAELRTSVGLGAPHATKKSNANTKHSVATVQNGDVAVHEIDQHFFDEADRQIKELMRMDAFPRFRKSGRYRELKTVFASPKSPNRRTLHGNSNATSTASERLV